MSSVYLGMRTIRVSEKLLQKDANRSDYLQFEVARPNESRYINAVFAGRYCDANLLVVRLSSPPKALSSQALYFLEKLQNSVKSSNFTEFLVDPKGIEPSNLTDANRALSQLSYGPRY